MKRFAAKFFSLVVALSLALGMVGQITQPVAADGSASLTTLGAAYTQDFDTLALSGTTNATSTLPTGWTLYETGGGARDNEQYAADTGGSGTGDTYSYGSTSSTDRAFGGLQSGTIDPTIGASFTNNTGGTISSLAISYTGEQWRLGTAGRMDFIKFQYSTNASSLEDGTWIDASSLDFFAPVTTTIGAKDGNAAANRTMLSHTITGLSISNGSTIWIRWISFNASDADDGLAIDDFSLTPSGTPIDIVPTVASTTPADSAIDIEIDSDVTVTFSEAVTVTSGWANLECAISGNQAFGYSGGPTTFTINPTFSLSNNELCTLTIYASEVTDQDGTADAMAANYVSTFTTIAAVTAEPKINEFSASTAGTDVEFVEVFGTPSTDYSTYRILEIEGDSGTSQGTIDEVITIGTTDANGLYLTNLAANALENGTLSLLLVKNFTGAHNTDLDTNNDGVFDSTPWEAIIDSVAVNDGGAGDRTYGSPTLTVAYDGFAFAPGGASRIPDGYDTEASTDWVRNDFDLAGISGFTGTPVVGEAYNTPGALNSVVPPLEPKINEFSASTAGTDVEYVEIFGTATIDYSAYKILEIEGDSGSPQGTIDEVINIGTSDANGLYLASLAANDLENGTISLLLVKNFTGALGNDLDTNNDGAFDITPWDSIIDSVAVNDGGAGDITYGVPALGVAYDGLAFAPGGASRIPDGYDTESTTDWVRNDFDLAGIPGYTGTLTTGEALNTPGAPNALVPPDLAPTIVSTYPASLATDVPMSASITITFSEAVTIAAGGVSVSCPSDPHVYGVSMSAGDTVITLDPLVNFDPLETCTVTVTAADVTDQDTPLDNLASDYTFSFTTMADPCTLPYTPIYEIQGSGDSVALTEAQSTMGVVVGDFEGASPALRGFYIQDPTGDGNPSTSDAIFIFEGSNANTVNLGDWVRVSGTPYEYEGQSQISVGTPVVCGTGYSVTPTTVDLPVADLTFMERYEGMLVTFPEQLFVTENYYLGRFGQVTVSGGDRLDQPTAVTDPGAPAMALDAANQLNKVIVDDSSQTQNPDPIVFGRGGNPLSASNTLRGGDSITGLTGVMTYTWSGNSASGNAWRVRPVTSMSGYYNFAATNPRPTAVPAVGGTATIVGMNVLNYFNTFSGCTLGVGGASTDCRGAENATEFDRQWAKIVAAITALGPDVLGVVEIENDGYGADSAIQDLVNKLNSAAGAGTYAFIDVDTNTGIVNAMGTDAIKNAVIYKPARVTPVGTTAILDTVAFVNGGDSAPRNRVSVMQAFEDNATSAVFLVDVNHLKSKGSACEDPDLGDGQGNCNIVRLNAVYELVSWFATDPTGTADPDIIMLGDLNSYAKEDPIKALEEAGFINSAHAFLGDAAYSYVFNENVGGLDYAMESPSFYSQTSSVQEWHINADEPIVLDYNTNFISAGQIISLYSPGYYRMSDHDPVVVGFSPDGTWPTAGITDPVDGAVLAVGIHELTAIFSEDVMHDGGLFAADNPSNYMLVEDGINHLWDTLACGGIDNAGPQSDDVELSVDSVVYDPATFTATLTVNGGVDLPEGRYRLFVCGTTTIHDLTGNSLNNGAYDTFSTFRVGLPTTADAATLMPSTGFAPDRVTELPAQTASYAGLGDLWLEIPSLKVKTAIVGVPITNSTWDVTWLGNQAGWLEGSSYPTSIGNSVLTAHVWDALNKPGTFFALNKLQYGQNVIVHSYGRDYIYAVRQVLQVSSTNVEAMLKHQDDAWITLVTCQGWNEAKDDYNYRVLVRAVLVDVR